MPTAARSFFTSQAGCDVDRIDVKNRRLVAQNSKWKVYFDHLSDGHGNEVPDYMVIEGRHALAKQVTGIAVLPVFEDRFVLIRSYRHALRSELWEVPRGFVDAGESAPEAALRELTEETGLSCEPANLDPLGFYAPEASTMAARGALFAATECRGVLRVPNDEMGLIDIRSFSGEELTNHAATGEIEDAGTLIAYYRFLSLLRKPRAPTDYPSPERARR